MNYEMYSIYDRVVGLYGEPFYSVNCDSAKRRFFYLMNNAQMVSSDCDLYFLGSFDNTLGKIDSLDSPKFICRFEASL